MDKPQLRQVIRQLKRQYSSRQLETQSLEIIRRLEQHPRLVQARRILLYYSLPDEVNTHDLTERLYQEGKQVFLPKVLGDGKMEIRVYHGRDSLHEGTYHIMEPLGPLYTDHQAIELALVPGMSFDQDGNRLGRGKGYYDRFLAATPSIYKIGVCFDFQKTAHVPCNDTDVAMDEVV